MASVLVRIIDSAGNIVEEKELQEYQIQVYRDFGFTVNYLNDNSLPTTPEPTQQPTQLSPEVQQIFDGIFELQITVPDWFRQNNMNFVLNGQITNQEFLNSYNSLVDTGVITIAGIPAPTEPEPDESQVNYPMVTQNANTFMITENDRVTGNIVFDKIQPNWNTYYDDRNLIAWFQLKDPVTNANVSSQIPTKSNIVKFPISTEGFVNPLDRIQTITIDESAMGYKKLKVELKH